MIKDCSCDFSSNLTGWVSGGISAIVAVAGIVAVLWVTTMQSNFVYSPAGTGIVTTGMVLALFGGIPSVLILSFMTMKTTCFSHEFPQDPSPATSDTTPSTQGSVNYS